MTNQLRTDIITLSHYEVVPRPTNQAPISLHSAITRLFLNQPNEHRYHHTQPLRGCSQTNQLGTDIITLSHYEVVPRPTNYAPISLHRAITRLLLDQPTRHRYHYTQPLRGCSQTNQPGTDIITLSHYEVVPRPTNQAPISLHSVITRLFLDQPTRHRYHYTQSLRGCS